MPRPASRFKALSFNSSSKLIKKDIHYLAVQSIGAQLLLYMNLFIYILFTSTASFGKYSPILPFFQHKLRSLRGGD